MRRRATRWGITPLVLALLLTSGATARADACSDCGPPTLEDLEQEADFELEERFLGVRDEVHLHAGECRIAVEGEPVIRKLRGWLVLRGSGAVWNCPSSTGTDTMTATVRETDSRGWSFSASSSASASFLGVGLSAEVVARVDAASSVQEVTTITKEMTAGYCRVIAWYGYFEVADYEADVAFKVERRFAWWTKNLTTGDTVHRSGEMWLSCGTHEATLDMRAPISGYFNLRQFACPDPECKGKVPEQDLGFFPKLPPGLLPPVTPGDGDEEDPEEESPDELPPPEDEDEPAPEPLPEPVPEPDAPPIPSSDELGDPPTGALPAPAGDEPGDDVGAQP